MKFKKNRLKSIKIIILPLYILYTFTFEVLLGFGFSDIWDRLMTWSLKKSKRSTL